jgi:hypothetical protein
MTPAEGLAAGYEPADSTCASGEGVWYARPERTRIYGVDLFSGLSRIHRYHGQFGPWSVLDHLVLCRKLVQFHPTIAGLDHHQRARVVAAVVAHDMHEAYVLDVPTGMKRHLVGYAAMEDSWEAWVHRSIGLGAPADRDATAGGRIVSGIVNAVDWMALLTEMDAFGHHEIRRAEARAGFAFDPAWRSVMFDSAGCAAIRMGREFTGGWIGVTKAIEAGCDVGGALRWSATTGTAGWLGVDEP